MEDHDTEVSSFHPLVPTPPPRRLNWDRILAAIPEAEKDEAKTFILLHHLDYFIDGDHPVGYLEPDQSRIRFLPQTKWIEAAREADILDLNRMAMLPMDVLERRQFYRDLGYSLQRYGEVSILGHRGWFGRHMCDRAPTLLCEGCRPVWFLQEGTCPCKEEDFH